MQAESSPEEQVIVQIMFIEAEQVIDSAMVARETRKDPILSKALYFTKHIGQRNQVQTIYLTTLRYLKFPKRRVF